MKVKNKEAWEKTCMANAEGYGRAVVLFAEAWADLMEARMLVGEALLDVVELTEKAVHKGFGAKGGITGFQYGAAVAVLAECWEHGEELRRWHNLNIQVGTEGEEANERGATLNPALLRVQREQ